MRTNYIRTVNIVIYWEYVPYCHNTCSFEERRKKLTKDSSMSRKSDLSIFIYIKF